jgi:5'-3' exonuclease
MMARNLVGDSDMKIGDNNWPLSQIDEEVLMGGRKSLAVNWKETYTHLLSNSIEKVCKEYLYGIQWIWAYYTGGAVCFNWFYPYSLTPLWEWLIGAKVPEYPGRILVRATDIRTVEQLALVLPLESWNLIPACPEKKLPYLAPQFYPERFSFETIGKRFFWECESMIPLPSILEVKRIIQLASSSHT